MNSTTTVRRGGFRVEDITFRNARQQSDILNEGVEDEFTQKENVEIPKSMTPEQVKTFLLRSIEVASSTDEKRVYSQMIEWIDELIETKKKLVQYELEKMRAEDSEATPDDLQN